MTARYWARHSPQLFLPILHHDKLQDNCNMCYVNLSDNVIEIHCGILTLDNLE